MWGAPPKWTYPSSDSPIYVASTAMANVITTSITAPDSSARRTTPMVVVFSSPAAAARSPRRRATAPMAASVRMPRKLSSTTADSRVLAVTRSPAPSAANRPARRQFAGTNRPPARRITAAGHCAAAARRPPAPSMTSAGQAGTARRASTSCATQASPAHCTTKNTVSSAWHAAALRSRPRPGAAADFSQLRASSGRLAAGPGRGEGAALTLLLIGIRLIGINAALIDDPRGTAGSHDEGQADVSEDVGAVLGVAGEHALAEEIEECGADDPGDDQQCLHENPAGRPQRPAFTDHGLAC